MILRSDDLSEWVADREGLLIAAWTPEIETMLAWEPPFAEALAAELHAGMLFGERGFTAGDRLIFRQNNRGMGVRNGTLGTVAEIEPGRLAVRTDDGRQVELDPTLYQALDHAYAVTVHKAQGVSVDQAHVLATRGFDRHTAYVALSRHRETVKMVHSQEAFAGDAELAQVLGRKRSKDFTMDYQQEPASKPQPMRSPEQQRADEIAQMFAEQTIEPERTWEIKQRDLGWGL